MRKGTHHTKKTREKLSKRTTEYFKNPEARERISKLKKEHYQNHPEARKEQSKRTTEYFQNHPEAREEHSKRLKEHYQNHPGAGEEHSKKMKEYFQNHPEAREKNSKKMKEYYKNPEAREKARKRTIEYFQNHPGAGEEHSKRLKEYFKNHPEVRKEMGKKKIEHYKNHPESIEKIREDRAKRVFPVKDTKIEVKVQNLLKQLGYDFFTHQYMKEIKHSYQCDIFIPALNLVIEADGNYWHKYPVGREIDYIRTKELIGYGFKVLRLWESEINEMDIEKFRRIISNKE